jgi:hypothetical protein
VATTLTITLAVDRPIWRQDESITFTGTYANVGDAPLALTFWWNRLLRVTDAQGHVVAPGPGPVLPCGAAEDWTGLKPGERLDRIEPLGCTQPAGQRKAIGWSYVLAPGRYKVRLICEWPPAHGFTQSSPHAQAFRGHVESNEVDLTVEPPAPKEGLLARLLGR